MKARTILSTITIFLLASGIVFAQAPMKLRQQAMGAPRVKLMQDLKLTEEQRKEIEKIRFEAEKQAIAQRAKIAAARVDLRQLFRTEAPDKAAIEKKIAEISQLTTQAAQARIGNWFAINKLLTADQQKIWKRALVIGAAQQRMQKMRQQMSRPGMQPPMMKKRMQQRMHPPG